MGLEGTHNGRERCIGKRKLRDKTMRGDTRSDGMYNGIAVTPWL